MNRSGGKLQHLLLLILRVTEGSAQSGKSEGKSAWLSISMARNFLGLFGLTTIVNGLGLGFTGGMNLAVKGSGTAVVNGIYVPKSPTQIPVGFARLVVPWLARRNKMTRTSQRNFHKYLMHRYTFERTCDEMGWDSPKMWKQLSNQVSPWWKHSENESYIYYNKGDGQVMNQFLMEWFLIAWLTITSFIPYHICVLIAYVLFLSIWLVSVVDRWSEWSWRLCCPGSIR